MLRSVLLAIDATCAYRVMCRVAQLAQHREARLTVASPISLLEQARAIGAQLVVIGNPGLWGLRIAGLLGKVPVLLARVSGTESYRRPLVAFDGRRGAVEVLDFSRQLLSPHPVLDAVHGYTRIAEPALASLGSFGRGWTRHIRYGYAPAAIASVAEEMRADLVIVGSRPRSAVARVLFGSITRTVVDQTSCDVLAVPVP
jgi:nucleotide-binding universal stress UspA family protein